MSINACKKIARFFGVAQIFVLQLGGYVDKSAAPDSGTMTLIVEEGNKLSEQDRQEVLEFIRMKKRLRRTADVKTSRKGAERA